jgi:hypothetical protein
VGMAALVTAPDLGAAEEVADDEPDEVVEPPDEPVDDFPLPGEHDRALQEKVRHLQNRS